MTKKRIKDMIRDAENAVKTAAEGTEDRAKAESRLAFLKEMQSEGFTVNQDGINDTVAAETDKAKAERDAEWTGVVGCGLDETREAMESFTEEELSAMSGESASGSSDDEPEELSITRLREMLSERDEKITDLSGKYDASQKQADTFQRTIMGERVRGNLLSALKAEGLNERYRDIAVRNAQYDRLLEDALAGNEPDEARLKEIASGLKEESGVWFMRERDPNLAGIDPTPDARDIPTLTDEMRAEQSASVF